MGNTSLTVQTAERDLIGPHKCFHCLWRREKTNKNRKRGRLLSHCDLNNPGEGDQKDPQGLGSLEQKCRVSKPPKKSENKASRGEGGGGSNFLPQKKAGTWTTTTSRAWEKRDVRKYEKLGSGKKLGER